eukprot:COSAG02_NODE_872_length_16321_cov_6.491062_14_plen_1965_part_00
MYREAGKGGARKAVGMDMSVPQEVMRWFEEADASATTEALTEQLEKLPYGMRVRAVSVWANRHRNVPVALATIKALVDAPPSGEALELSVDEEVSNLFPPQRTAVTNKFHVHQAGVFAAAASSDKETLKDAAASASRLMKRLAVKEVTRHVSDQELDTMIRAALPKDRKEFMHQCMRFRKHAVLDAVFEAVIELDGEAVAARVLHGLTSPGVAKHLPGLITNKRLLWPKLWRFHEPVLLAQLSAELEAAHRLEVHSVWSKWEPFFSSPLVRTTHHRTWRELLGLFLKHRPVILLRGGSGSLVKEMTNLSKQGKLPENPETVKFVTPSWVLHNAMPATVRNPCESTDPSAFLLDLVRSSMINFEDADDGMEQQTQSPVELKHGSLASEALRALLDCAEQNKKFDYPLEAVLDICRCITEKVPLDFVYSCSFPGSNIRNVDRGAVHQTQSMQNAVAAYQLAMSTLQTLVNAVQSPIGAVTAVTAVGNSVAAMTTPTPGRLGIDLRSGTLLARVASAEAVESVMDTWLSVSCAFCDRALTTLADRGHQMAERQQDLSEVCAAMTATIMHLKEAHVTIGAHGDEYAQIWKQLKGYGIKVMMNFLKQLTASCRRILGTDQTVGPVQPLKNVYHTAAAAIVEETLLPSWREQLQFNRTDEYRVGGPCSASTRGPYQEELAALRDIASWIQTAKHNFAGYSEQLICEVLHMVTKWCEWAFSTPVDAQSHWFLPSAPAAPQWMPVIDSVRKLCSGFQQLASEPACMPKLAVQAYEASLNALKLTHFNTQTGAPLEGPLVMHSEKEYIAALCQVPLSVRSEPGIKDPAVEMILSYLQQALKEKDSNMRAVKSMITRLPSEIKKSVVTAALVPGGALDELPATAKQELHPHADLSDPQVSKILRKATDSSQTHRRLAAMETLLSCAFTSESLAVMTDTLNFVASRTQNETAANRDAVLRHVFDLHGNLLEVAMSKQRLISPDEHGDEDVHTSVWLRLLEDLTCSADFEDSTSLYMFSRAGSAMLNAALMTCVDDASDGFQPLCVIAQSWAELGVEMVWRVHVATDGSKKAVESFGRDGLRLSQATLKAVRSAVTCILNKAEKDHKDGKPGAEDTISSLHAQVGRLVDFVHGLYHTRVQASAAYAVLSEGVPAGVETDWAAVGHADQDSDDGMNVDAESEPQDTGSTAAALRAFGHELEQFRVLVQLVGRSYSAVPLLQGKVESACSAVQTAGHTALRSIEGFVSVVMSVHTKAHPWQGCPALVSYHDTLLRRFGTHGFGFDKKYGVSISTPACPPAEFLSRWLSIHLPRKEDKKAVGRPAFQARKAAAVAALLDMSPSAIHINLVWRFLVTHRQDLLAPFITPEGSHIPGVFHPIDGGVELEERAGAAFINPKTDWAADEQDDTPAEYHLPATYGLRKLLQPHAAVLAEKWKAIAVDTEIAATERTKGVARYCSNPAIAFSDQVETINELWSAQNDRLATAKEAQVEAAAAAAAITAAELTGDRTAKADAIAAAKAARTKKSGATKDAKTILPLPVSEALLEGMMRGDEPSAPFGFLLSPQMLARTEARVTMQVLNRAIGMIPPTDIVKFVSVLLGNRDIRRSMKVTVHKSLLRLLRHSTDEGPLLVLREWKRKELHRDVRIVILQCALELLHTSGANTGEEVWTILESAAADVTLDPVVKAVLLAPDRIKAPKAHHHGFASDDLLKLLTQCDQGAAMHDGDLPMEVHERYFEKVICVLDAAELAARTTYAEEAETAAAEVLELKTTKARGDRGKQQLAAAATRSADAKARGCAADDLRALLATTLEAWGAVPARSLRVAGMLSDSLCDEATAVLDAELGFESADRNTRMFRVIPEALVKVSLQTRLNQDGNTYEFPVEDLRNVLENAVTNIAGRVMSVSLGERSVRNACFERLLALHDSVLCHGKTEDKELLRGALAPMAWLKEEATQMTDLARKRLPTEQEQRKAKKARHRT